MKIACLGWGSLIWKPGNLLIQNKWFEDGAFLPIEFTRQSNDGRITLIIDEKAKPVRTLWALMTTDNLQVAIESLKVREGIKNVDLIHFVTTTEEGQEGNKKSIAEWLRTKQLDAAVWTGLSFSDKTQSKRPDIDYVINYLKTLNYTTGKAAEEYIRKAPKQIDTEYRRRIELEFGWTCLEKN